MLRRLFSKLLLDPSDVEPTRADLEVVSAFNPGVILDPRTNETIFLVRIAERPRDALADPVSLPRWVDGEIVIDLVPQSDVEIIDPRVVRIRSTGTLRLTFASHVRVYRSRDGKEIDPSRHETFAPEGELETFGVEDPRITHLEGRFWITYVSVSKHGASTSLAVTDDFRTYERLGVIFPPENKDVLLFPERIDGDYVAIHRPNPSTHFSPPEMWIARSPDLIHWGRHEFFLGSEARWEQGRIGGGAPPLRTERGWLEIYHGNDRLPGALGVGRYYGAAILLDADDPARVIARSDRPIFAPELEFERQGFVDEVVFPTAVIERDDELWVYYGAADRAMALVAFDRRELLESLR